MQKHWRLRLPPRRNVGRPPCVDLGLVIFYLAERTAESSAFIAAQPRVETATRAVPPRLLLNYSYQAPENLNFVMYKIELPLERLQSSIPRLENQEKQP